MILRGAVVSENRRSLEPARKDRPPEPVVVERVVSAPITYDAVLEWLTQGDSRARLSAYLADDVTSLRSAARAEGLAAGKTEGLASAKAEAASLLEALETLVSRAELALQAETEELSSMCAEVVCAALAKIAGPVLSMREAALGTVLEVLKRVKDERELTIRVSAHDLPALRASADDIEKACAGRRFTLVPDQRVEAGGCIVESSLGTLDGRFDVQLRALAETLRAAKNASPEPQ
jgi:flagellar assembly protein FliH